VARLWEEGFWKPAPGLSASALPPPRLGAAVVSPIVFLVSLTIGLTVFAGPVSALTTRAAEQLLDRTTYVRAVLGEEVTRAGR
jgi:multicomponent Na+:H+ antiporter subunit D